MYKLCYFVPESHLESSKQAIFESGAGHIGDYDRCAWQCLGEGQFRPLDGSDPYLGSQGDVERVREYKVELICRDELIHDAIAALRKGHPYEEPAFEAFQLSMSS